MWSNHPCVAGRRRKQHAGSADAIGQNLHLVHDERPDYLLVVGADHIYRMDPRQMLEHHVRPDALLTVAAFGAPL